MNKRIFKLIIVSAIVFVWNNNSVVLANDTADRFHEALIGSMEESSQNIKNIENIVNKYKVTGVHLLNDDGDKIICKTTPTKAVVPSFLDTKQSMAVSGDLPECNPDQIAQLTEQAKYSYLDSYGENKVALGFLGAFGIVGIGMYIAPYFSCAYGALETGFLDGEEHGASYSEITASAISTVTTLNPGVGTAVLAGSTTMESIKPGEEVSVEEISLSVGSAINEYIRGPYVVCGDVVYSFASNYDAKIKEQHMKEEQGAIKHRLSDHFPETR